MLLAGSRLKSLDLMELIFSLFSQRKEAHHSEGPHRLSSQRLGSPLKRIHDPETTRGAALQPHVAKGFGKFCHIQTLPRAQRRRTLYSVDSSSGLEFRVLVGVPTLYDL